MGFLWAIFMPMIIVASGILVKKSFFYAFGKTDGFGSIGYGESLILYLKRM